MIDMQGANDMQFLKFCSTLNCVSDDILRTELLKSKASNLQSTALANLKSEPDIDFDKNVDLLPVVFPLAIVNKFNANGDGIDNTTAASILNHFKHKPFNIEHKKKEIVGHMFDAYFSSSQVPSLEREDQESFANSQDCYYIMAMAVIYRHVFPELCAAVEDASDPESENYQSISSSWELGFKKFDIYVGSDLLSESSKVEDKNFNEYKPLLKAFKGKGSTKDGLKVNRLIQGHTLPLGAALTMNPAAEVEGVYVINTILEKSKASCSLNTENPVNLEKIKSKLKPIIMTDTQLDTLVAAIEKAVVGVQPEIQSNASSISQTIKTALTDFSKTWESSVQKAVSEKESVAKQLEEVQSELTKQKQEFTALQQEMESKAAIELFGLRMGQIDELFTFDENETRIVASEVKNLAKDEESFNSYLANAKILFKERLKTVIAEREEEVQRRIDEAVEARIKASAPTQVSTASTQDANEDIQVDEKANASVPNTNSNTQQKTLAESLKGNFQVKVTI